MDTKIYKILPNIETDIYNSSRKTKINYLSIVNTEPAADSESITKLFVRDLNTKVVITPNGLILEPGTHYERENVTLNPDQTLSILTTQITDIYLSVWDD